MKRNETQGVNLLRGNPKEAVKKLALPLMLSMMVISLYNIIDSFWVAGLGADQLAAVGFVIPLEFLTLLCKNSPASLSRGMNCTFSGLVSIFFLCGWGGEISFQMLSDKCHIICRFIICNIERWGKNFNKLIFFLSFF